MKESDIRPANILSEYLALSARDAVTFFSQCERVVIPCPACLSEHSSLAFTKHGFEYRECASCKSLFLSPRPTLSTYEAFYRDSESSRYWAEVFFPSVAEARREKIFQPRAKRAAQLLKVTDHDTPTIVDVGAGYGMFLEEWRREHRSGRLIAVEPSKNMAEVCRNKRFEVHEALVEDVVGLDSIADLVVCFEVFEHAHDPFRFLNVVSKLAKSGGHVLISTLGVDGFDIQTLWENSNAVFPPHHINFFSRGGFLALWERVGLRDVQIMTPGTLDVDIVRNAMNSDPALLRGNRFLGRLLDDPSTASGFQSFLVEHRLSSHTWILARR
jgi:SAM-dependent methyltransferase